MEGVRCDRPEGSVEQIGIHSFISADAEEGGTQELRVWFSEREVTYRINDCAGASVWGDFWMSAISTLHLQELLRPCLSYQQDVGWGVTQSVKRLLSQTPR